MRIEQIEKVALLFAGAGEFGECPYNPDAKNGFMAGAQWRINSVWHDADEEPERSACILIDLEELESVSFLVFMKCDDSDQNYHANSVLSQRYPVALMVQQGVATWGEIRGLYRFKRWAYVSDLLPEKKGGSL